MRGAVLRRIVWSLNAAYEGRHPTHLPQGKALPEHLEKLAGTRLCPQGRTFSVTEIRGDWAWHRKLLQFKPSWNSLDVCHECRAKSNGPWCARYYNFTGTADWESRPYTPAEFISRILPERDLCGLLTILDS